MKLIDLDECVMNALDLFIKEKLPRLDLGGFKRPLVVGSGNAAVTGKIIMGDKDAVFADEGNYKHKLRTAKVDGAVLISASGGKHAPLIAKDLKKRGLKTVLLTNNSEALAKKFVDKSYVLPKNVEPYTYNTSTYVSMILSKTREDPKKILKFINALSVPRSFGKYNAFYLLVPEKFDLAREMFLTKFDELFGGRVSGRVFTLEQTKHAKTVVPFGKEFFIGLGEKNKSFGKHRWSISLPNWVDYGGLILIGYYIIGKIQKQHPAWFKSYIEDYTENASKIFGQEIKPIVT